MSAINPIAEILAGPLPPDWTADGLAERLLAAIAAVGDGGPREWAFDASAADSQSRRLIRPLLACLAAKSAMENDTQVNLHGGHLSLKMATPTGPVWIVGQFANGPGNVRVTLRRSTTPQPVPAA